MILGVWGVGMVTATLFFESPANTSAFIAHLEQRVEAPREELPESEYEVSFDERFEDPVLVETAFTPQPEPPEPLPETPGWLLPEDPLAELDESAWKSYAPVEPEPEPEPEIVEQALPEERPALPEPTPPSAGEVDEPLAVQSPPIDYPRRAWRLGWEGTVRLRIEVDAMGIVRRVELVESSGHASLDEAAIKGFKRWAFRVRQQGEPDLRSFVKSFRFVLPD